MTMFALMMTMAFLLGRWLVGGGGVTPNRLSCGLVLRVGCARVSSKSRSVMRVGASWDRGALASHKSWQVVMATRCKLQKLARKLPSRKGAPSGRMTSPLRIARMVDLCEDHSENLCSQYIGLTIIVKPMGRHLLNNCQ